MAAVIVPIILRGSGTPGVFETVTYPLSTTVLLGTKPIDGGEVKLYSSDSKVRFTGAVKLPVKRLKNIKFRNWALLVFSKFRFAEELPDRTNSDDDDEL
jgi:hypothetical protein